MTLHNNLLSRFVCSAAWAQSFIFLSTPPPKYILFINTSIAVIMMTSNLSKTQVTRDSSVTATWAIVYSMQ